MNYITHLNEILELFHKDSRLNSKHVSLYMALFRQWNRERFPTWIYISRKELMKTSRIGSTSTYHRIIRDLNNWKYLTYRPSFFQNPGSKVKILGINKKGIPLEIQLSPKGCSLMGHPHPKEEQLTLYNKHRNIKEFLFKNFKVLEVAFQKENLDQNQRAIFLEWLNQNFKDSNIEKISPSALISTWCEEITDEQGASHFEDHLQVKNVKRYDQPL